MYRQYQAETNVFSSEAARAEKNRHFLSICSDYLDAFFLGVNA
jgi:hypothetical protein